MRTSFVAFAVLLVAGCNSTEPSVISAEAVAPRAPAPERPVREHYLGMAVPDRQPVPFPNINGECEPGQRRACPGPSPRVRADGVAVPIMMHCARAPDGTLHFNRSECATPLVVTFDDAPVAFTRPAGSFTVGPFERTEWVSARSPWLGLDTDDSGCIEAQSELFRFDTLKALDENHDGRIDASDAAYGKLVLWFDRDQDRRCTAGETVGLAEAGIVALSLDYVTPELRVFGSHEGERASIAYRTAAGELRRGRIIDVYLAPLP